MRECERVRRERGRARQCEGCPALVNTGQTCITQRVRGGLQCEEECKERVSGSRCPNNTLFCVNTSHTDTHLTGNSTRQQTLLPSSHLAFSCCQPLCRLLLDLLQFSLTHPGCSQHQLLVGRCQLLHNNFEVCWERVCVEHQAPWCPTL